ncbi:sugar porter family MFS transporter [Acidianus sp. DSM 29099]|nr:sugar porter family MFS transporter [Acidianus sp. RZ1]
MVDLLDTNKVNRVIIVASLITAIGGFLFGYDTGIIGSALPYVTPYFHLGTTDVAFLVAGESAIAGLGALAAGPIVDRYGRKKLLIVDGIMYAVFALLTAIAISGILLIIWRSLIGFAIGADTAIATGYISELSPKRVRGRLAIIQQLMIFSGITASFWAGYFLSFTANWRLMFGLGAIPAIILIALRFYLPESPRWLLIQGQEEKAKESLKKLGLFIKENIVPPKKEKNFKELLHDNKSIINIIIIVGLWLMFQQVTGINIILYYGPTIYRYLGLTGSKGILYTAISESLGGIEEFASFLLIDKWGRRKLGIFGYSGLIFSLLLMVIGAYYLGIHIISLSVAFIFSSMILYLLFYHAGVGGVGWVLQGETLPTEFRGRGMGILAAIDWFSNFFIIYIFPFWKASFGIFSFFIFELILSVLATIYVILLVPETKGVPLDEIPRLFNKNLKRYWKIAKKEESK